MRLWCYRHRHAIVAVYLALAVVVTLLLQSIDAQGGLP